MISFTVTLLSDIAYISSALFLTWSALFISKSADKYKLTSSAFVVISVVVSSTTGFLFLLACVAIPIEPVNKVAPATIAAIIAFLFFCIS